MKEGFLKKALITTGRVTAVAVPAVVSIFSLAVTFTSIDGVVKANHRVKAINRSVEDSELLHRYDNDEGAIEVLDNTLYGDSKIKSASYADALISSREQINAMKDARSALAASAVATGLFSMAGAGLAAMVADLNSMSAEMERKERERKEEEERERLEKEERIRLKQEEIEEKVRLRQEEMEREKIDNFIGI